MKKLLMIFLLGIGVVWSSIAQPVQADTIMINFGKSSQIFILINDKGDLEILDKYDFNQMMSDLKTSIESSGDSVELQVEGDEYSLDEEERDYDFPTEDDEEDDYDDEDYDDIEDDDDDDYDYVFKKDRKRSRGTKHSIDFDIGINNYLEDGNFPDDQNQPYTVKPFGSWYVSINSVYRTRIVGPLIVKWGGGVDWYNFKFEDPSIRIFKGSNSVIFLPEPSAVVPKKSKLTAAYVNMRFVPTLDFGSRTGKKWWDNNGGFSLGVGGYAAYRIDSYSKFVFEDGGDRSRDREKSNFFLNNWRYGVRVELGIDDFDFFANYDISELFSEGNGPRLNAFTFGIRF